MVNRPKCKSILTVKRFKEFVYFSRLLPRAYDLEESFGWLTKIITGRFRQIINDSLEIDDIFIFALCLK